MKSKQIKIINNRIINKYFYISTLSQWHFCCEPEFKELWLKNDSPLNKQEKEALKIFARISKKYGFTTKKGKNIYLGIPFITSSVDKVWSNVKKLVNKQEFEQIENIFKVFEPRFKKVWQKNKLRMDKIVDSLNKKFSGKDYQRIIKDLETLFGSINKKEVLTVYLQMAPAKAEIVGGGANFGSADKISLEVSGANRINEYLLVIYHELTHFYTKNLAKVVNKAVLENKKNLNKIKDLQIIKQRKIKGLLDELITLSIFPDGILGQKYFPKDVIKIPKNFIKNQSAPESAFDELEILTKYIILNYSDNLKLRLKTNMGLDNTFIADLLSYIYKFKDIIKKD